jgi:uncharacterized protein YndB with AHSA1/START domain
MSDLGAVERKDGRVLLRFERHLPHPVEVVWRALTDPVEHGRWSGWRPEIDLRLGGEIVTFHGSGEDEQRVVDRVTRLEPPHVFACTFWADATPSSVVTWELEAEGDGCRLVLTHAFDEGTVPSEVDNASGWHGLLDGIAASLRGESPDQPDRWTGPEMAQLRARYTSLAPPT